MICVFGSFLLAGQRVIAEFGIGLASAVLLDAFILRTILVPAVMHLIGERNWWLPKPLDRVLPKVAVEGSVRTVRSRAEALRRAARSRPVHGRRPALRDGADRRPQRAVDGRGGARARGARARSRRRFAVDEAWMRAEADALVAAFGDEVELRAEYAGPFAARVMQHVLGLDAVPIEDLLRGYVTIAAATVGDIPEEDGRKAFAGLPLDSDTAVALFGGIDTMEGMILNLVLHVLTGQATTVDGSLALDPAVGEVHRYDGDELVVIKLKDAALPFAAGSHACPGGTAGASGGAGCARGAPRLGTDRRSRHRRRGVPQAASLDGPQNRVAEKDHGAEQSLLRRVQAGRGGVARDASTSSRASAASCSSATSSST